MTYQIIKDVFEYLGFTPDKMAPLLVLGFLGVLLINRRMKPVEKIIGKIEKFIIRWCAVIESEGDINKIELYKQDSPITLTEKGLQALEKIGFKNDIDNNLDLLFKMLDKLKPQSALDVEQFSIGLIRYTMGDKGVKIFKKTEDYIYTHPEYNNYEYFKAAGLYLRNKYLKKYPELVPKEDN